MFRIALTDHSGNETKSFNFETRAKGRAFVRKEVKEGRLMKRGYNYFTPDYEIEARILF